MTRVIFAGGGTAGHVEPALSVARHWKSTHTDHEIQFIGTRTGLETRLVPDAGFQLRLITKVAIPRKLSLSLLTTPFALIRSITESVKIMRDADLLVGFGGYVSGPAYLAAAITRTPFIVHEANARAGLANRLGALFTPYTAITHEIERGKLSDGLLTGLPLREDIVIAYRQACSDWKSARSKAKTELGFESGKPLLFIFGGSQGSAAINAVIEASREDLLSSGLQLLHGVGAQKSLPVQAVGYKATNYITDMATAYLAADIVISRSGAVTCAEVNTLGRYALFIPLPIGNGEQELNAQDLIAEQRAEILSQSEFNSQWIISNIESLISKSAAAPVEGSALDIDAASKIASLMEHAMHGSE